MQLCRPLGPTNRKVDDIAHEIQRKERQSLVSVDDVAGERKWWAKSRLQVPVRVLHHLEASPTAEEPDSNGKKES
jgi:hypothetical protein